MQPLVGKDLAGVLPRESVLTAAVQKQYRRTIAGHAAVPLIGDEGEVLASAELHGLRFAACRTHGILQAGPEPHVTDERIASIFGPWTSLLPYTWYVQPETVVDSDDRECIIEAAYMCLSEPHSGPIPVAAILQRARVSTRRLPPLRIQGRTVPGDAACGDRRVGRTPGPHLRRGVARSGRPAQGLDLGHVRIDSRRPDPNAFHGHRFGRSARREGIPGDARESPRRSRAFTGRNPAPRP